MWLYNKDVLEGLYDELAYRLPTHTDLKQIVLAIAGELGRAVKCDNDVATDEWGLYVDVLVRLVKLRDKKRSPQWFRTVCDTISQGVCIAAERRDGNLHRYRWLRFGFSMLKDRPRSLSANDKTAAALAFSEKEVAIMVKSVENLVVQLGTWMEECGYPSSNFEDESLKQFVSVVYELTFYRWPQSAKELFGIEPLKPDCKSTAEMLFTPSRVSNRQRYDGRLFCIIEKCCVARALPSAISPDAAKELIHVEYKKHIKQEYSLEIQDVPTELGKPPSIKITWGKTDKVDDVPVENADKAKVDSEEAKPIRTVPVPPLRRLPAAVKVDKLLKRQLEHSALILKALEFYRVEIGKEYRKTGNPRLLRPPEMPQIEEYVNVALSSDVKNGEVPKTISQKTLQDVLMKALGASINHIKKVLRTDPNTIGSDARSAKAGAADEISKIQRAIEASTQKHPYYFDPRICAYWIGFCSEDFVLAKNPMYKLAEAFKEYQTIIDIFKDYKAVSPKFLNEKK